MSNTNNAHHQPLLVLALFAALIALTVSYSIDAEAWGGKSAATATDAVSATRTIHSFEMPTLAPSAIVLTGQPAYRIEDEVVKIYFPPSKTEVPLSAERVLGDIVATISNGQRVQISGFHDETGNPSQNVFLSKKRAEGVRQQLIALGAPAQLIELKKPMVAVGSTDHAEARRVEVTFLNQ